MTRRLAVLACLAMSLSAPATARAEMVRLASNAQVRSISFHFIGPHEIPVGQLEELVSTRAPGPMDGLKRRFGWLPLVPDAVLFAFEPRRLQEDVARLRLFYRRQSYLAAVVQYDVKTARAGRRVSVTFLIREGPPVRFRQVVVVGDDSLSAWGGDSTPPRRSAGGGGDQPEERGVASATPSSGRFTRPRSRGSAITAT
jgi:hypothetical protein